jgi:HlyD family secretion protein
VKRRHQWLALMIGLLLCSCGRGPQQPWFGYAEGKDIFVSPTKPGWLSSLSVRRGDYVKKGQVLFSLDDTHLLAARDQTEIALAEAKQQLASLRTQIATARSATASGADSLQLSQLLRQEKAAEANLAATRFQLSRRQVVAPMSGKVEDIYFRVGQFVPATTPVMSVLPAKNVFVRFFVPQAQFSNVRLGERVHVRCDVCSRAITARITFIARQQQIPPPMALLAASRQRLVFQLEARAREGMPLNPGQSVDVTPDR